MESWFKKLMVVLVPYTVGGLMVAIAFGWSPAQYSSTQFAKWRASQAVNEYITSHPIRKLQIGAGPNSLKEWLNTDIEPAKDQVYLDATAPFPIPSNSFDYVFAEQLIEHVTLTDGQAMLRECHRILRDGGKIRIATPNLTTFAKLFIEKNESSHHYLRSQMQFVNTRRPDGAYLSTVPTPECEVLNMQMHFFGHRYLYDPDSLRAVLSAAGFQKVQLAEVGLSSDPALSGIDSHAKITGDELNRFVTMVVEASK
jgi:predicted SAM-dependent methyltransferase